MIVVESYSCRLQKHAFNTIRLDAESGSVAFTFVYIDQICTIFRSVAIVRNSTSLEADTEDVADHGVVRPTTG